MASVPPISLLRNILQSQASDEPNTLTIPSVGQVSWEEIFHKHRHRPASDLLWLATWDRLPVGQPVANIAPDNTQCPWCPSIKHSTLHLFHQCHIAQSIWDTAHMIYIEGTHSLPPPQIPNSSLSECQLRLIRSIQSAVLTTLWNAFTSRAFGHDPTPTHHDIVDQLLGRLLYLRTLDIHLDPLTPWIKPTKILSLIMIAKNRYTPPSP